LETFLGRYLRATIAGQNVRFTKLKWDFVIRKPEIVLCAIEVEISC